MKRLLIVCVMFLGLIFTGPAWSHHAAEGIVSDDIWEMIDSLLEGSPHLDLDLTAIMNSMDVTSETGYLTLVSRVEVETVLLDEYMAYIDSVVATTNGFPSGNARSETADTLVIDTLDLGDGTTMISIYEPIGFGNSQGVPVPADNGRSSHNGQ